MLAGTNLAMKSGYAKYVQGVDIRTYDDDPTKYQVGSARRPY